MEVTLHERVIAMTGDLTEMEVDAIVNAANSSLMGGGGVDGAIHRKGGPSILAECREIRSHRYPEGLPAGKAVVTTAGDLSARYVIHTVGPIWKDGKSGEKATLAEAYHNSLLLAAETGLKTVAFPAISTGVYRFPKDLAAVVASRTITSFLEKKSLPRTVYMVFFSEADLNTFLSAVRAET